MRIMSKVADIIHRQDFIGVESTWHEIKEAVKSTPTMVFSVIGDSENFVTRAWPTNVFQTALIEAAKSGGDTWILYRGLNSGVSKIISDAYLRYVNLKCSSKSGNTLIDDVERHIKLISFAGKQFLLRNNINPTKETVYQFLEDFKQLSKPYAVNETYQGPTSLPLYYYFGHLLLEEMGMIKECGPILLCEALKANRCDYVEGLLNQGVTFDIKYLPELYEQY
uniref:TRPM SLOG domain-containing protein n=1 Tax=Magallana gigas TaxID=29159 RepID=K1PPB1_MAGGI